MHASIPADSRREGWRRPPSRQVMHEVPGTVSVGSYTRKASIDANTHNFCGAFFYFVIVVGIVEILYLHVHISVRPTHRT